MKRQKYHARSKEHFWNDLTCPIAVLRDLANNTKLCLSYKLQINKLTLWTRVLQTIFLVVLGRCNEIWSQHWEHFQCYFRVPTFFEPSMTMPWCLSKCRSPISYKWYNIWHRSCRNKQKNSWILRFKNNVANFATLEFHLRMRSCVNDCLPHAKGKDFFWGVNTHELFRINDFSVIQSYFE